MSDFPHDSLNNWHSERDFEPPAAGGVENELGKAARTALRYLQSAPVDFLLFTVVCVLLSPFTLGISLVFAIYAILRSFREKETLGASAPEISFSSLFRLEGFGRYFGYSLLYLFLSIFGLLLVIPGLLLLMLSPIYLAVVALMPQMKFSQTLRLTWNLVSKNLVLVLLVLILSYLIGGVGDMTIILAAPVLVLRFLFLAEITRGMLLRHRVA